MPIGIDRGGNGLSVNNKRGAVTLSSTVSKKAEGNVNQASAAGSAGRARAVTPAAGAVQAVMTEAAAKTGAATGDEPEN